MLLETIETGSVTGGRLNPKGPANMSRLGVRPGSLVTKPWPTPKRLIQSTAGQRVMFAMPSLTRRVTKQARFVRPARGCRSQVVGCKESRFARTLAAGTEVATAGAPSGRPVNDNIWTLQANSCSGSPER